MTSTGRELQRRADRTPRPRGGFRADRAMRFFALWALAVVAACAPVDRFIGGEPSPVRVFSAGFKNVSERYIEPVDLRDVAVSGLNSMLAMDPDLDISDEGAAIQLRVGNIATAQWPAPRNGDPDDWGRLVAEVLDAARAQSLILRSRSNEDIYTAVFEGVLTRFDRYSRYASAEKANRRRVTREGFGGLGISINYSDGLTSIIEVHPDTPAETAGLKAKDIITHVDGAPIDGLPQRGVIDLLRGPIDSRVELTVTRPGTDRPVYVAVVRALIVLPTVRAKVEDDVLILRVSGFNQGTAAAARRHIRAALRVRDDNPLKGIILDVRGNPGGLLDQAVQLSDLFLEDGLIISTKGRHYASDQVFDASSDVATKDTKLVILINGKSASAAEIVAAALRDRGRGVLLGSSSYGKGSVQTVLGLPNGGELTLTWARLMTPAGQPLQEWGVVPTICTNGNGKDADELRESLRSAVERPRQGDQIARLGSEATRAKAHRARRSDCPPDSDKPETDMEIARFLLSDHAVYDRFLHTRRPSIASR